MRFITSSLKLTGAAVLRLAALVFFIRWVMNGDIMQGNIRGRQGDNMAAPGEGKG